MARILKIICWAVFYIFFLEVFLRLSGVIFISYQELQNKALGKKGGVYKVLCLGDSITAIGGEDSYPSQLEGILNKKPGGVVFRVYNKGLPSADSTIIMQNVDQVLREYQPDMVTVMLGYNDRNLLQVKTENSLDRRLKASKVYLLGKDLVSICLDSMASTARPVVSKLTAPAILSPQETPAVVDSQDAGKLIYAIQLNARKEFAKAEIILKHLIALDIKDRNFIGRVYRELGDALFQQKKYQELCFVIKYFLQESEFDVVATEWVRALCSQKAVEETLIPVLLSVVAQNPNSERINGMLGACSADYGHQEQARMYLDKVRDIQGSGDNQVLKNNYLALHHKLKTAGIQEVFVQYPNRSVGLLRKIFEDVDHGNILFVSNVINFEDSLLSPEKYSEFFLDRRGDDFGHATALGNYILARNIADAIFSRLK